MSIKNLSVVFFQYTVIMVLITCLSIVAAIMAIATRVPVSFAFLNDWSSQEQASYSCIHLKMMVRVIMRFDFFNYYDHTFSVDIIVWFTSRVEGGLTSHFKCHLLCVDYDFLMFHLRVSTLSSAVEWFWLHSSEDARKSSEGLWIQSEYKQLQCIHHSNVGPRSAKCQFCI